MKIKTFSCLLQLPCCLLLLAAALTGSALAVPSPSEAAAIQNFESEKIPTGWRADDGGALVVTETHFKSGERSLCWTWSKAGAVLEFSVPDSPAAVSEKNCLALWVYNETPAEKIIPFEVREQGKVIGKCWFVLNFSGWRTFAVPFAQLGIPAGCRLSRLDFRLVAPTTMPKGGLFLDYVNFLCLDTPRPDDQQPWIGKPEILHSIHPELFIYSSHDLAQNRHYLKPLVSEAKMSQEEIRSMEIIRRRVLEGESKQGRKRLVHEFSPSADSLILDEINKTLTLKRSSEGVLTGRPIVPGDSAHFVGLAFNSPADGVKFSQEFIWNGTFKTPLFERLVKAYLFEKKQGHEQDAAKLLSVFFDMCDHLLDQGFAAGNGNISRSGADEMCILSMREELEKTGRLRNMLLGCAATSLSIGDPLTLEDWAHAGYAPRNVDISLGYQRLLVLLALLPDSSERLQRLYAFQRALGLYCDPSLGEPYSWDGVVQHHPMFHIEYGLISGFDQARHLGGTCFQVFPAALSLLSRALDTQKFLGGRALTVPPNIPGYTGQPNSIPDLTDLLVQCGAEYRADPSGDPVGHKTLNSAAIALHRRHSWLVSLAGQFKFRRTSESNPGYIASIYNQYARNGSVFVVSAGDPPSPWSSGFRLEGWDPRHQPGTTHYMGETAEQLRRKGAAANQSAFGGGTDLDGDGIWGLELIHANPAGRDCVRFHKSAFCFGDRITMITTDIGRGAEAGADERSLEFGTTLFQNAFGVGRAFPRPWAKEPPEPAPTREPCWIDSEKIVAFPFSQTLSRTVSHWLLDNQSSGYFIHSGGPPLTVERREQTWTYPVPLWNDLPKDDPKNSEPTRADYATAWFSHGAKPEFDECVYSLFPATTPQAMTTFAQEMEATNADARPYVILQKDATAHVLRDRVTQTTGYVIFNASAFSGKSDTSPQRSRLRGVNRPCSVMVKESSGALRLSVSSTDLDEWTPWAAGKIVLSGNIVLTISGEWDIGGSDTQNPVECRAEQQQGQTIVTIPYQTFMPVCLNLRQR